jgi:CAAX prenyl protease-like protein
MAFWATAVLFATEHGPYWEVGLLAGVIYNWWMVQTRSLMDCMIAHAITNACLAIYVVAFGHWEYWL